MGEGLDLTALAAANKISKVTIIIVDPPSVIAQYTAYVIVTDVVFQAPKHDAANWFWFLCDVLSLQL